MGLSYSTSITRHIPPPRLRFRSQDYFPEGGSQDEERERLSDPEPSETPSGEQNVSAILAAENNCSSVMIQDP